MAADAALTAMIHRVGSKEAFTPPPPPELVPEVSFALRLRLFPSVAPQQPNSNLTGWCDKGPTEWKLLEPAQLHPGSVEGRAAFRRAHSDLDQGSDDLTLPVQGHLIPCLGGHYPQRCNLCALACP